MPAAPPTTNRTLERGIAWRPRHDAHFVVAAMLASARNAPPLCVTQQALVDVAAQLRQAHASWHYGLLTGRLCHCPRTEQTYVLVDGLSPCPPVTTGDDIELGMARELTARVAEADSAGRLAIGPYRGAAMVVPRPSPGDVELLRSLFAEPWQAMLLCDRWEYDSVGAFVRVEPIHDRAYAIPFVELLPKARGRQTGEPPASAVVWSNYYADEEVDTLPLPAPAAELPPVPAPAPASGGTFGTRMHRLVNSVMRPRGGGRPTPASGAGNGVGNGASHVAPAPQPVLSPVTPDSMVPAASAVAPVDETTTWPAPVEQPAPQPAGDDPTATADDSAWPSQPIAPVGEPVTNDPSAIPPAAVEGTLASDAPAEVATTDSAMADATVTPAPIVESASPNMADPAVVPVEAPPVQPAVEFPLLLPPEEEPVAVSVRRLSHRLVASTILALVAALLAVALWLR